MTNNKKLTLSIVIPAYNEQDYLRACLDSVADQTIMPTEVIVVDNNSTDQTAAIASEYNFVKLIKEPRQGVFYASTTGFNAASSDVIGRIDSDTVLRSDWVEQVLAGFTRSNIAAVTGPVNYYDMPLPQVNFWFDHIMRWATYNFSRSTPFLYGSNLAVSRKAWSSVCAELCKDQDIHEDIDLAIHLRNYGYQIAYDKHLMSGASGRRYNDSIRSFSGYLAMYRRTYARHKLHSPILYPALFLWSLGYLLMHPWRGAWYKIYGKFSRRGLPFSAAARKNPMSS